jgi:hypothetical protein
MHPPVPLQSTAMGRRSVRAAERSRRSYSGRASCQRKAPRPTARVWQPARRAGRAPHMAQRRPIGGPERIDQHAVTALRLSLFDRRQARMCLRHFGCKPSCERPQRIDLHGRIERQHDVQPARTCRGDEARQVSLVQCIPYGMRDLLHLAEVVVRGIKVGMRPPCFASNSCRQPHTFRPRR